MRCNNAKATRVVLSTLMLIVQQRLLNWRHSDCPGTLARACKSTCFACLNWLLRYDELYGPLEFQQWRSSLNCRTTSTWSTFRRHNDLVSFATWSTVYGSWCQFVDRPTAAYCTQIAFLSSSSCPVHPKTQAYVIMHWAYTYCYCCVQIKCLSRSSSYNYNLFIYYTKQHIWDWEVGLLNRR